MITNTTIYTGGDSNYWKQYGRSFVNSFKYYNPEKDIFVQLFNPDSEDIKELNSLNCKYQVEVIDPLYIDNLVNEHINIFQNNTNEDLRLKLKHGMSFSEKNYGYVNVEDKMRHLIIFSVYASFRFIRLAELWKGSNPVVAYDMDTVCNGNINIDKMLGDNDAGCLSVKGNRFVVSLVAFRNNCQLLNDWGISLKKDFDNNQIYGFLDQDTFVNLSKNYKVTHIDRVYCDHTKKSHSSIVMTGKGTAKFEENFKQVIEKWKKYKV